MSQKMVYNKISCKFESIDEVKQDILKRLNDIAKRKDNWDGHGSKGVNPKSVKNAKDVLFKMVDTIVEGNERAQLSHEKREYKTDDSVENICENLQEIFDK